MRLVTFDVCDNNKYSLYLKIVVYALPLFFRFLWFAQVVLTLENFSLVLSLARSCLLIIDTVGIGSISNHTNNLLPVASI